MPVSGNTRMGKSFTEFRGHGFWSYDGGLQVWLRFLPDEIDMLKDVPDWVKKARDHWNVQATYRFCGCMTARLDDFLAEQPRIDVVGRLAQRALSRMRAHGTVLSRDFLNSLRFDQDAGVFTNDVRTEIFVVIGERFLELLAGRLNTHASTSPVY
jgi:hypothetical protein